MREHTHSYVSSEVLLILMILINQDIPEFLGNAVLETRAKGAWSGWASFLWMCYVFLAPSEIPIQLIQQHWFFLDLCLLICQMKIGDVISFRSLVIIGNRFGKHNMSSVYYFTIIAHNSKLWLFIGVIQLWNKVTDTAWYPMIIPELLLDRRHEGLRYKHRELTCVVERDKHLKRQISNSPWEYTGEPEFSRKEKEGRQRK